MWSIFYWPVTCWNHKVMRRNWPTNHFLGANSSATSIKNLMRCSFAEEMALCKVSQKTHLDYAEYDIVEWEFIEQSLRLRNVSTRQVLRSAKKDGDYKPCLMKINFAPSWIVDATLEVFRTKRRRLQGEVHMHPDKPHDPWTKRKIKLELTVLLVKCQEQKTWKCQALPTQKYPV